MSVFKTSLLAATALTLLAGSAMAQSNEAKVAQDGRDNVGLVTQTDGRDSYSATYQLGTDNFLQIDQSGNGNTVGVRGGASDNVMQDQNRNVLFIDQDGSGNAVASVNQKALESTDGNVLDIDQIGTGNLVAEVVQDNVGKVSTYNVASLSFDGDNNGRVRSELSQTGGTNNDVDAAFVGNDNDFRFVQQGSGNYILSNESVDGLTGVVGNGNYVGVDQYGSDNSAFVGIRGNDNNFAATQFGDRNELSAKVYSGNGNNGFVLQNGDDQFAQIDFTGDANTATIEQIGFENDAFVNAVGNNNTASVFQNGTANYVTVNQ